MAAALISAQVGWGSSKEFLDLVKAIGECRSKAEEDKIVVGEIELLKKKMAEPDVPKKKMKEYVIRLVYVEMLGHNASFGYIHAVKVGHKDSIHKCMPFFVLLRVVRWQMREEGCVASNCKFESAGCGKSSSLNHYH
jgi:hypothetical protein